MKRITELTIDRSKWMRGEIYQAMQRGLEDDHDGGRKLESSLGSKCCLGFLSEACDPSIDRRIFAAPPLRLAEVLSSNYVFTDFWHPFIDINDCGLDITSRVRETKLKKLFKDKLGINLTFTGSTPRIRKNKNDL